MLSLVKVAKVMHKNGGVLSTATPTGPEISVCRVSQGKTDEADLFEGTASSGGVISTATPTGPETGVCRVGQRETDESDPFEGTASSGQKDPGFAASLNPGIVSCQTPLSHRRSLCIISPASFVRSKKE